MLILKTNHRRIWGQIRQCLGSRRKGHRGAGKKAQLYTASQPH